jgi:hypothetical protein
MGTIRNGCTLIVVLDAADGSYVIDFTHFILFLFVYSDFMRIFAAELQNV